MKERPILFSGPLVRVILAGRKTQTRRLVTDLRVVPRRDVQSDTPSAVFGATGALAREMDDAIENVGISGGRRYRADHEDRRPIVRLAVGAAVIAADRVHLELTADTAAGQRGALGNPNASPVRHGIPVEVPIVPPRPQTYRPRRTA